MTSEQSFGFSYPCEIIVNPSKMVSFADVAHQMLLFDSSRKADSLILELLETKWVQRLRNISQTGNTKFVYMFAEHSRFGHSLGVGYLAVLVMRHLARFSPEQIERWELAVAAAALLHDVGHVAPGSHLAEHLWGLAGGKHEQITIRIIREDPEIGSILSRFSPGLLGEVCSILEGSTDVPPWCVALISGGGWNADRGNWSIVDSTMCAVTYGRYNVPALVDAFRLSANNELVLQESRVDALTHFYVARDSMYRQIYQHRVLQAADALTESVITRIRDLVGTPSTPLDVADRLKELDIFADQVLVEVISNLNAVKLDTVYQMTEAWWGYHLARWRASTDTILADLSSRLVSRKLLKTIRLDGADNPEELIQHTKEKAEELCFDPRYYVKTVSLADKHRGKIEDVPLSLLDNGTLRPVTEVEPTIKIILSQTVAPRRWLAVPNEVKAALGITR